MEKNNKEIGNIAKMEKIKIAIVANHCIVGGVETALINLLKNFDFKKYNITLFTNFNSNPCVNEVSDVVKLVDLNKYGIKKSFFAALSRFDLIKAIHIFLNYMILKVSNNCYIQGILSCKHMKFNFKTFDYIIAYKHGWSSTYIAKHAISSDKSIVFIHGALPSLDKGYLKTLCSYDKCFCVSEYLKEYFLEICPEMSDRTEVFHNILNDAEIKEKSLEAVDDVEKEDGYIIVTVGRLSSEKGQVMIPEIAHMLTNNGVQFRWYIVGDGPERVNICNEINKYDVADRVILLGTKSNPYPYMRMCDIYVQTSTSEGWCLTTQEARILHKPCVVSDIPVMHEQFINGVNGIIASGKDAKSIYDGIIKMIGTPGLSEKIIDNLKSTPQNGSSEIQKLYDYINN